MNPISRRGLLQALFAAPLATKVLATTTSRDLTQVRTNVRIATPVEPLDPKMLYDVQVMTGLNGSTLDFTTTQKFTPGQRVSLSFNDEIAFTGTVIRVELDLTFARPYLVYAEDDLMRYPQLHLDSEMTRELADQVGEELLRRMKSQRMFGA